MIFSTRCRGGVCAPRLQSFAGLWEVAQSKGVPLRTAAFIKALQRVTRRVETAIASYHVSMLRLSKNSLMLHLPDADQHTLPSPAAAAAAARSVQ